MTDVPSAGSVRMIFEFAGDDLRLLQQHPVNVAGEISHDQQPGDYVEVRGRDGRAVSRVPVRPGLGTTRRGVPRRSIYQC